LPEAEAELVAGYNVEYSGIAFAGFFLGEYSNILLMSSLFVIFFLGGGSVEIYATQYSSGLCMFNNSLLYTFSFSLKVILITFIFIFIRANLPRFRFDQLMYIGWKVFLPLSLSFIFFFTGVLLASNSLNIKQLPFISPENSYIQVCSVLF
jgi:NADH-quinone oxidoreductase subunit H